MKMTYFHAVHMALALMCGVLAQNVICMEGNGNNTTPYQQGTLPGWLAPLATLQEELVDCMNPGRLRPSEYSNANLPFSWPSTFKKWLNDQENAISGAITEVAKHKPSEKKPKELEIFTLNIKLLKNATRVSKGWLLCTDHGMCCFSRFATVFSGLGAMVCAYGMTVWPKQEDRLRGGLAIPVLGAFAVYNGINYWQLEQRAALYGRIGKQLGALAT